MAPCKHCSEDLPFDDDYITCFGCKGQLHYLCANVREQTWRKNNAEQKRSWRCFACKTKTDSLAGVGGVQKAAQKPATPVDKHDAGFELLQQLLPHIRNIIREENLAITTKMDEFQKAIDFYGHQIDSYTKILEKITDENKKLSEKYNCLETKYIALEKQIEEIKINAEEDRQYARNHNVEINGLQEIQTENLTDIAITLGKEAGMSDMSKADIQAIHRVNSRTAKIRPVIIQFTNRSTRDDFLRKIKVRRPTLDLIYPEKPKDPIYINDHLTPYYRGLLYEAKNKKNDNNEKIYKYVWFKDFKLFARRTDSSNIIRIKSAADI